MFDPQKMHNFLMPLIASNTVSSDDAAEDKGNRAYCDWLANQLELLNFKCAIEAVPNSRNKWNLIAHREGSKTQHGGLMFSGHSDTVPANVNQWQQDPWALQSKDEKWQGLGVTDMKGFFAVLLSELNNRPKSQSHPLTIIATADEETSMAGARALEQQVTVKPAMNIIGEPTLMQPILSHKGYLGFRLNLFGPGGHSSINNVNSNCLDAMQSVIQQLQQLRQQLQHQPMSEFSVPVTTLNLGSLHAGDAVNRICAHAQLEFDIRPLPGVSAEEIHQAVLQATQQGITGFKVDFRLQELYPPLDGFHSSLNQQSKQLLCQCTEHKGTSANYVTEGSLFEQMGIPSVVLGPGSIEQAHTTNEWISFQQVRQAQKVYSDLLSHYAKW